MSELERLSDEEFERLQAMPFEELTDDEKRRLNFRIMAGMPDEVFSYVFNRMLDQVFKKPQ